MLGKNIRALRLNRNMTIGEVASRLEIQLSALSKYERDEREPDYSTIIKIADYFNVSVDWLLGRVENPQEYVKTNFDFTLMLRYNHALENALKQLREEKEIVIDEECLPEIFDTILRKGIESIIEIKKLIK